MIKKRWVKLALIAISTLAIFFYLPACFVYVLSPRSWWFMGILSIGFTYLWFSILLLFLCWFFINRKTALLFLLLTAMGLLVMKNVFALHTSQTFSIARQPGHIRLMQWNCNGLQGDYPTSPFVTERPKAIAFIQKYQPDVICAQDFADTKTEGVFSNLSLLSDTLGYPYFLFKQHYKSAFTGYKSGIGIAIFSKYPIADSGLLFYPGRLHPETILWADIKIKGQTIRFATTHFQSMHLTRKPGLPLEPELWQDSAAILHGSKLEKLKHFQSYHVEEAEFLHAFADTCNSPFILTCDLNSNPSSYVYKKVKGNLKDAFLESGFGFGKSYHSWQPALRIDYIFHDKAIQNQQTQVFPTTFSDHDPVLMDFIVH